MDKQKSIEALQYFVTGLSEGAFVHKVQGQLFKSKGLTKLGQKYQDHYEEEMGWVEKFIDRILDLGGTVKVEEHKCRTIIDDPIAYIKDDYKIQVSGVELLHKCMDSIKEDVTTYDIFKDYYKDEEEDLYWMEQQMELIEKIGTQNWYFTQV